METATQRTFTSIFQSINKAHLPLLAMILGLIIRVVLTVVLVRLPNINIFGAIIAQVVFLAIACVIMSIYLKKHIIIDYPTKRMLWYPLVIGGVVLVIMYVFHMGLKLLINYFFSMVISVIIGLIIYVVWVYWGGIFDKKDRRDYFSKKKKLIKR